MQASWARQLLGAEAWRNEAVCESELGWCLSGAARGVRSVALRRARVLCSDSNDWYRSFFIACSHLCIGWAGSSSELLRRWGVPDWPKVCDVCVDYGSYSDRVTSSLHAHCAGAWKVRADTHGAQIPYCAFQCTPSTVLMDIKHLQLSFDALLCVRAWCRLRAGLICMRALHKRRSTARYQQCIFCGRGVRNATVHAVAVCPRWCRLRSDFVNVAALGANCSADVLCLEVLRCPPSHAALCEAVYLADALDQAATRYWKDAVM